jgi:threonine/homoserine/homoserine lactone efflux protein
MTLYVILPEPISRGYLIDAQVQGCETAAGAADAAIQTWEQRLATTTWPNLDPNWRNKARQMLQTDRALVLDMIVLRRNAIVEGRKPWNKGRMIALGWQASNEQQSYYARLTSGSCADYGAGARSVYFSAPPGYHPSAYMLDRPNWPSGNLPEFVHRELLEPVPEKYRELVGAASSASADPLRAAPAREHANPICVVHRRMTELELLIKGMIAGLMIAAPVGPVNILCINRTLTSGWKSGVICGIGAAAADMFYGAVAGFSISLVIQFLVREQSWINLVGSILLIVIGISYFFKQPKPLTLQNEVSSTVYSNLRLTFLLTLTNPTTVLSFLAVLAALGVRDHRVWWLTVFLVVGVFWGSMAWWVLLSSIVNHFRDRFNGRLLRLMNRFAGIAMVVFGLVVFLFGRARL